MDAPRKLIVGYDLCDDITQISCYSYKTLEPIPISNKEGEEYAPIPTVLCVKTNSKQWLYGEEAVICAANGEGTLVDHLLTKLQLGDEVELFHQKINGITLMEKFLRKSLTLIKGYFPTEPITKLVVTLRNTDPMLVEKIYEALALLGLDKDRVVIINHSGAYMHYVLNQNKSIWMNDVGLFDFNEEGLNYYQIQLNRRTKPMIAGLSKSDYTDTLSYAMLKQKSSNVPYVFENIVNIALHKQMISTLYFTGNGFEGGWADETIKLICQGKRGFYGQNLFTKGACYAAKEFAEVEKTSDFILLNNDMITNSISLRAYSDAKFMDIPLAEAGETWFEVNKSLEVIPEGNAEIEVILRNILTKEVVRERIPLNQLQERPDLMTRLEINLTCKSKTTGIITVTDLGFGEFYPESEFKMEFSIQIG